MATAADGDGDGSAFDMGSNNGNDAAIADEVRHGRTAPFSARATAAAKEASSGLKRNRVGHIPLGSSQGGITDIRFAIEFAKFSPRIMEKWKEGGGWRNII